MTSSQFRPLHWLALCKRALGNVGAGKEWHEGGTEEERDFWQTESRSESRLGGR